MEVAKRSYGVDVSSFQDADLSQFANLGAKFAVVKLSEGLDYRNPKAQAQINSAKANNMLVMGYHYARFSGDSNMAVQEGRYTVNSAKEVDLPKGSYLACDWETGSGNVTDQGYEVSANAILAFLDVIAGAGYRPLLYSGKSLLTNNVNVKKITDKYGTCLWVAGYPLASGVPASEPDFGYFPSMDGVAIWQFTDNWRGLNVDGNITLKELITDTIKVPAKKVVAKPKSKPKTPSICYVPILYGNPNYKVRLLDSNGHYQKYINTNTRWKVWAEKTIRGMKCYKIGTDTQWVPAKFTKIVK